MKYIRYFLMNLIIYNVKIKIMISGIRLQLMKIEEKKTKINKYILHFTYQINKTLITKYHSFSNKIRNTQFFTKGLNIRTCILNKVTCNIFNWFYHFIL